MAFAFDRVVQFVEKGENIGKQRFVFWPQCFKGDLPLAYQNLPHVLCFQPR